MARIPDDIDRYGVPARDLEAELDDFDGTLPESWKPKPGDKIIGRVLRYDRAPTPYGEAFLCVLAREPDGKPWAVWLTHTVLLDTFKKQRPCPGERIGIKRLENHPKGYALYCVRVDRAAELPGFAPAPKLLPAGGGK